MINNCGTGAVGNYSDYYSTFFGNHYATKGYGSTNGSTCASSSVAYQGYPVAPDNCCSGGFSAGVGQYDTRCYYAIPAPCPITRSFSLPIDSAEEHREPALIQTDEERAFLRDRRRARRCAAASADSSLDTLYKEVFSPDARNSANSDDSLSTFPVSHEISGNADNARVRQRRNTLASLTQDEINEH